MNLRYLNIQIINDPFLFIVQLIFSLALIINRTQVNKYLYPDGRTIDLIERDALSYHNGTLKPLIFWGILIEQLSNKVNYNPFYYQSPSGSSVKKCVDYVIPYATGALKRQEWVNSKVAIDKARAKAGIEKYRPGKFFKPIKSLELFEMAGFYEKKYLRIAKNLAPDMTMERLLIKIVKR